MRGVVLIACALAGCGTDHLATLDWADVSALVVVLQDGERQLGTRALDRDPAIATVIDVAEGVDTIVLGYTKPLGELALEATREGALRTVPEGAPLPPAPQAAVIEAGGEVTLVDASSEVVRRRLAGIQVPRPPCPTLQRVRGSEVVEWPTEPSFSFVAPYAPRAAVVGFRQTLSSTGAVTLPALWRVVDGTRTRIEFPDLVAQPKGFAEPDGTVFVLAEVTTSTQSWWCRWPRGGPYPLTACVRPVGEVPREITAMAGARYGGRLEVFAVSGDQALHVAREDDTGTLRWRRLFQGGRGTTPLCRTTPRLDVLQLIGEGALRVAFVGGGFERVTVVGEAVTRVTEFAPATIEAQSCRTAYVRAPQLGELFARLPQFDLAFPSYDVFWRPTPETEWKALDVFVGEPRLLFVELSGAVFGISTISTAFTGDARRLDLEPLRCPASPLPGQIVVASVLGNEVAIATEGTIDTFPVKPSSLSWYEVAP